MSDGRNLGDQTLSQFLESLSCKSPTPGGGCASAVVGAMAAALLEMFCQLTIGKKKYQDVEPEMQMINAEARKMREQLVILAQRDTEVFDSVMNVRANPAQYKRALKRATAVPYRVAKLGLKIFGMASQVVFNGNQNARSDARVAIYLARAAVLGAIENMRINLEWIEDESFCRKANNKINAMLQALDRD